MTTKEKGQPEWSQETLLGMGWAFMESRVLLTGAELDLFTLVAAKPENRNSYTETEIRDALEQAGFVGVRNPPRYPYGWTDGGFQASIVNGLRL